MAGVIAALGLVGLPLYWIARRVAYRDPAAAAPSRLRRALAAAWTMLVLAVIPLLGVWALSLAIETFDLRVPRIEPFLDAIFDAARVIIVINAVGRSMLAPFAAPWRVVGFSDRSAILIFRAVMTIAAIWAVEREFEPAADAVASLNIAVAARAAGSALIALTVAITLRRLAAALAGPPGSSYDAWAPTRTVVWALAFVVFAAVATGYVAFGTFLVNQALSLTVLGSILYLIDVIVQDGAETLLKPEATAGGRLFHLLGLKRNTLAQLVVILQGVARLILVVIAAAAVLEPWGVQSQDMFGSLRAAYFGFAVGGITLSLSSMIAAAAVFGVIVLRRA